MPLDRAQRAARQPPAAERRGQQRGRARRAAAATSDPAHRAVDRRQRLRRRRRPAATRARDRAPRGQPEVAAPARARRVARQPPPREHAPRVGARRASARAPPGRRSHATTRAVGSSICAAARSPVSTLRATSRNSARPRRGSRGDLGGGRAQRRGRRAPVRSGAAGRPGTRPTAATIAPSSATYHAVMRTRIGSLTARLQREAHAADRADQRAAERLLELAAQVADVDVDDVGRALEVLVPDVLEQRARA